MVYFYTAIPWNTARTRLFSLRIKERHVKKVMLSLKLRGKYVVYKFEAKRKKKESSMFAFHLWLILNRHSSPTEVIAYLWQATKGRCNWGIWFQKHDNPSSRHTDRLTVELWSFMLIIISEKNKTILQNIFLRKTLKQVPFACKFGVWIFNVCFIKIRTAHKM